MKKIPQFVWLLVGLVAVATSLYCGGRIAWDTVYPSGTLRYKMTVSVETPEGIKTGSAVREIYFYRTPQLVPGRIQLASAPRGRDHEAVRNT
jgi:hypothetical protein